MHWERYIDGKVKIYEIIHFCNIVKMNLALDS